jgi:hypothetical protein
VSSFSNTSLWWAPILGSTRFFNPIASRITEGFDGLSHSPPPPIILHKSDNLRTLFRVLHTFPCPVHHYINSLLDCPCCLLYCPFAWCTVLLYAVHPCCLLQLFCLLYCPLPLYYSPLCCKRTVLSSVTMSPCLLYSPLACCTVLFPTVQLSCPLHSSPG